MIIEFRVWIVLKIVDKMVLQRWDDKTFIKRAYEMVILLVSHAVSQSRLLSLRMLLLLSLRAPLLPPLPPPLPSLLPRVSACVQRRHQRTQPRHHLARDGGLAEARADRIACRRADAPRRLRICVEGAHQPTQLRNRW
mmetsp:Transcript_51785/g.112728  ORF Transcript_51785/g.112728 Transcript_51785/m.112728 type:complete len:138 (-) Transcript_51785:134-547(-)